MKTLREEISKIINKTGTYSEHERTDKILKTVLKRVLKVRPDKKTEGILGILGTKHKDGVFNEGFNSALAEYTERIKSELK